MKKGFTLIELLIVISIIGILAVALLPNILSAPATARDAGRKAALNSVVAALEQVKASTGLYPKSDEKGTAVLLSSITNIEDYFKGGEVPVGAPLTTGTEAPLGQSVDGPLTETPVVYCPVETNDKGYSYVVAIRMEQPQGGANGLTIPLLCNAVDADFDAVGGGSSNWYFILQ